MVIASYAYAGVTMEACNKINLNSQHDGLCECFSENVGDSDEAVALMNWFEIEKKKDDEDSMFLAWLVFELDETRKKQYEELAMDLSEKSQKGFAECLLGDVAE